MRTVSAAAGKAQSVRRRARTWSRMVFSRERMSVRHAASAGAATHKPRYIARMSKARVTNLRKHYPELAPDKDYPPLKSKSLKGRVSPAEWEARVDCACAKT